MLRNYIKIAWRNILKNKLYSSINVIGLATGMAVALLIGLWIWNEFSFDDYHKKRSRLGRVMSTTTFNDVTSTIQGIAVPLAGELRSKYPGYFKRIALASDNKVFVLSAGTKKLSQRGRWVEPQFTEMFTFRMLKGNAIFNNPSSILLAHSLATALFGNENPINQIVLLDNKISLTVAGVYEDISNNASFSDTKFLLPWSNKENPGTELVTDWNNHHSQLYVELSDQSAFDQITARIKNITKPFIKGGGYEEILLHPMNKWLLYDEFQNGKNTGGRIDVLRLFGIIGVSILMLACINFMNLSTARSEKRAKEVGIRKAIGSVRSQLIGQFLSESMLMVCLSSLFTIVLAQLALPYFNTLAGKNISIPWSSPVFWFAIIVFTTITGVISGSYPAFYLSGFKPIKVLKGTFHAGRFASVPRKVLVVLQFTVSITLIIGTLIVYRQIQYAKSRPVGYSRESLITVNMNIPKIEEQYERFRNELIQTGAVTNMAVSSSPSTNVNNHMMSYKWKGKDPNSVPLIGTIAVTHDFGSTIGWKIKEGRDFSRNYPSDSGSLILNEAAVRLTGFKNPIGETMHWGGRDRKITGVIQDMVMESPYTTVQPTAFFLDYKWRTHVITLRINPTQPLKQAIAKVKGVFSKYYPDNIFDYEFIDEQYEWKFNDEQRISSLVTVFAIMTILISCLGLFGLASFVAEQRTKEVGVRKVLGATVFNLWKLLSKDFVMLVFISTLVAAPIAWYLMNQWLQKFEYRTALSWWIFGAAGATALAITLITVSSQAVRAASANPVKSLRTE